MKKLNTMFLEATTWLTIIVFTLIVTFAFPWEIAEELLRNVALVGGAAALFWYLKSHRLYLESKEREKELQTKQREILNRERTFDLIFDNSDDGFLFLDSDQKIIGFSPGMERITGFDSKQMIGHYVKDVLTFKGDTENSLLPDMMFLPDTINKKPHIKNTLLTKDGRVVDIEASCTLIREGGKKRDRAFAIIRDMTYENELSRRDKEFVAVSSHQLNTPLSIIKGYLTLIKNGRAGEINKKQSAYVDEIMSAVNKMTTLTNSMLSISRIEQEKITLSKSDINVTELLEKLRDNFLPLAKEKNIVLDFPKPTTNIFLYADPDKLYQVLANLVDNAIKYTDKGGVKVDIQSKNNRLIFNVIDTGIGISEEELSRIGEKFYRTQEAIDVDNKGTGLGVFIAKMIVEKHGGGFKVESHLGQGTTFEFSIPNDTVVSSHD